MTKLGTVVIESNVAMMELSTVVMELGVIVTELSITLIELGVIIIVAKRDLFSLLLSIDPRLQYNTIKGLKLIVNNIKFRGQVKIFEHSS
jgi:hypothetical protein